MPTLSTSWDRSQTISDVIRRVVEAKVSSTLFINDKLLGLFPREESHGGQSYRAVIHRTGNTAVASYTEGEAIPASVAQGYVQMSQPWRYWRVPVTLSGHLLDAVRTQEARFFDVVQSELDRATNDLRDLVTTDLLGTAPEVGIQSIIDANDTYGGLAPGTYTDWASLETAVGGALTKAVLDTAMRSLVDAERGASWSDVTLIASPTQVENYLQLQGSSNVPAVQIHVPSGEPAKIDIGSDLASARYAGRPIISMPDLTNTVWLLLDMRDWKWVEHRPITVEKLAKTQDDERWQITIAGALVCTQRRRQGKLTGVTP